MKRIASIVLAVFTSIAATVTAQQQANTAQQGGAAQAPEARIWAGVFSEAQATRGKATYESYCVRCHGVGLVGGGRRGAPPLKDDRFWLDFESQPLAALLSKMQRTMPADAPGTLREEDYLDVLAYVLSVNVFPSGRGDLAAAGLDAVPIARKPGTVREVPNFGLVRVVGCLASSGSNAWMLTNATAPASTREEAITLASRAEAAAAPLGTSTISLLDVARFRPAAAAGRRVEVRGLFDKTTSDTRLDVLSLEVVGESCGKQAGQAGELRPVWSGVYSHAQAERGSVLYLRACSGCHGTDLSGNEAEEYPALAGDEFMQQWEGEPLLRLVERIRTGMPFDRPGTLSPGEAVDIVAYVLRTNRVPEGAAELPPDREALQRVVLTRVSGNR